MSSQPLIQFNPKLPALSKNEREVLNLLVETGKLVVPIYKLQENKKYPGANFYPHNVTKQEIEKAAGSNPDLLSPYTIIERKDSQLTAVTYHERYASLLKPVAEKLEKAADKTKDKEFAKYLRVQAKTLLEGKYRELAIARMQMKQYILDIYISLIDNFDDQLFARKYSYQAWVGIVDIEGTKKFNKFKDLILSARRKALIPSERVDNNNVKARVEHAVLFSGLLARTRFTGLNLRNDLKIVEQYGSEIVLFKEANKFRVEEQIIPTFNEIFSSSFKQGFSKDDLRKGHWDYVALHQIAHSYLYYKNAAKNLQDLFTTTEELTATTLGIRVCGSLLLRDLVTTKELESMIIAFLCRSMYWVKNKNFDKSMTNYAIGGAIFVNFMMENGALKQFGGLAIPNFTKIFISLHELSSILERLLSSGTRKDAEVLIKKYG